MQLSSKVLSISALIEQADSSVLYEIETEPPRRYHAAGSITHIDDISSNNSDFNNQFVIPRNISPPGRSLTMLRNVYVMPNAAIVTENGNIIRESCYPYTGEWIPKFFHPWIYEEDGHVMVNTDNYENVNLPAVYIREHGESGFFHWMHSVFPRVDTFLLNHLSLRFSVLCRSEATFQRESLALVDLQNVNHIEPNMEKPQYFDELLFPSPLVKDGDFWLRPPSVAGFYGKLVLPIISPVRRIYLTRQGAAIRKLENEAELLVYLEKRGFVCIEMSKLSFSTQLAVFRSCDMVIAPHGAGLSHIINMQPGSRVLELLHPLRFWATYRAIAARCGLQYGVAVGSMKAGDSRGDMADYTIEVEKIRELLDKFGLD